MKVNKEELMNRKEIPLESKTGLLEENCKEVLYNTHCLGESKINTLFETKRKRKLPIKVTYILKFDHSKKKVVKLIK